MSIVILHVDDQFLIINKPTDLLCVPGRGPDKQDCVLSRLHVEHPELLVVHRLDMDTSGVMVFARTAEAQRELNRQFEKRETKKSYIARIKGSLPSAEGLIDEPMRKDMGQRMPPRYLIDPVQGKAARTRWEVLEEEAGMSRVRLFPETGRSHQLRVHMLFMGCPIVGDPIYGGGSDEAARLMLHAENLAFFHPTKPDEFVSFFAPVPF